MTVLSRVLSTQRGEPLLVDAGIKAMSSDGSLHGDSRIGTVVSAGGGLLTLCFCVFYLRRCSLNETSRGRIYSSF